MSTPHSDIETPIPSDADHADVSHVRRVDPTIPAELWMLWLDPIDDPDDRRESGGWLLSVDDASGGPTYLTAFSEAEALAAVAHQEEMYYIEGCRPVRVK